MANDDERPADRPLHREPDRPALEPSPTACEQDQGTETPKKPMNPERVRRIRQMILSYRDVPCYDCGMEYPAEIMEFDHVYGEKTFTISNWQKQRVKDGMTLEAMIRHEIAKCEVRCPTCHRIRHFFEKMVDPKPGGRRKGKKGGKGYINIAPKTTMNRPAAA